MSRLWWGLPLALVAACVPKLPTDLGRVPADAARLRDSAVLRHLDAAWAGDDAPTVADVIRAGDAPFDRAPDPSALLDALAAAHAALPPLEDPVELRVLTYNVGWLSRTYLGSRVEVPEIAARRELLPERLFDGTWDVLFLQEVWEDADVERLRAAAEPAGYRVWGGSERLHDQHGLAIAYKAERFGEPEAALENTFQQQRALEFWPGPGVRRGWLHWVVPLRGTSRRLHLLDVHATSFVPFYKARDSQARQVGRSLAGVPPDDVVLLGGDLNSAPYYRDDVWLDDDGEAVAPWWRNAPAWALWLHHGPFEDAVVAAGRTGDVALMDALPARPPADPTVPFGDPSWCEAHRGELFTGTDCNSLYFRQYGGTEPPARLDHVLFRDPGRHVRVTGAELVFVEPVEQEGRRFELSDHYGISVTMQIER